MTQEFFHDYETKVMKWVEEAKTKMDNNTEKTQIKPTGDKKENVMQNNVEKWIEEAKKNM